jgi:PKD domain-containing protein
MNASRATLAMCLLLISGCSSCGPKEESSAGRSGAGGALTPKSAPAAAGATAGKIQAPAPPAAAARQPNAAAPGGGAPAAQGGDAASATPAPGAPQAPGAPTDSDDCVVVADANPDFGPPPLAVAFTAEAECGQGATYKWDFGDGSSPSTEANPTHTYTKDGDYTASVTVSGANGATASDEIDIFVQED